MFTNIPHYTVFLKDRLPMIFRNERFRRILAMITAFGTLTITSGLQARAESPSRPQDQETQKIHEQICVAIAVPYGEIYLGRGERQIEIKLIGGVCEPSGPSISMLLASYPASDDSPSDVVSVDDCPAFKAKINELWSAKSQRLHLSSATARVSVGPFSIVDTNDLFELNSSNGKRSAAAWISDTLVAAGPCWNTIRDDAWHCASSSCSRPRPWQRPP